MIIKIQKYFVQLIISTKRYLKKKKLKRKWKKKQKPIPYLTKLKMKK